VSQERRQTARPLLQADARPGYSTAATTANDLLSVTPRLSMLRNLFRLLVSPSAHITGYVSPSHALWREKLLTAGRRRAHSAPPDHPQRTNEEIRPTKARACHLVPVGIVHKSKLALKEFDRVGARYSPTRATEEGVSTKTSAKSSWQSEAR
jgi:hypothetical protein